MKDNMVVLFKTLHNIPLLEKKNISEEAKLRMNRGIWEANRCI